MKKRHMAGVVVIALFIAYAAITFSSSLTPYVTFSQAKNMSGSVQVRGVLAGGSVTAADGKVQFLLRDEKGETATVSYQGLKPDGLEQAASIVAVGKYQGSRFVAERLLVKCPSKYQGSVKP